MPATFRSYQPRSGKGNRLSDDLEKVAADASGSTSGSGPGSPSAAAAAAARRRARAVRALAFGGIALAAVGLVALAGDSRSAAAAGQVEPAAVPRSGAAEAHVRALWAAYTAGGDAAAVGNAPDAEFWGAAHRLLQACPAGCTCDCGGTATPTPAASPTTATTPTATQAPTPTPIATATPTQAPTPPPIATATAGPVQLVTACKQAGSIAVTFDDGPYLHTAQLLSTFEGKTSGGAPARFTVFQNGDNYSCIYRYAALIRQIEAAGHQVASHTWSHADLNTLSAAQITAEMQKLDYAYQLILGKAPLYMRPPYGNYKSSVLNTLTSLGYRVATIWNVDTNDWKTPNDMTKPKAVYNAIAKGSALEQTVLSLQHDSQQKTVADLAPFIISWAQARNLKLVTVAQCLGDTGPAYRQVTIPAGYKHVCTTNVYP